MNKDSIAKVSLARDEPVQCEIRIVNQISMTQSVSLFLQIIRIE